MRIHDISTKPAEVFDNSVVDDVLELSKYGLRSVSLMYVGYADSQNDWIKKSLFGLFFCNIGILII